MVVRKQLATIIQPHPPSGASAEGRFTASGIANPPFCPLNSVYLRNSGSGHTTLCYPTATSYCPSLSHSPLLPQECLLIPNTLPSIAYCHLLKPQPLSTLPHITFSFSTLPSVAPLCLLLSHTVFDYPPTHSSIYYPTLPSNRPSIPPHHLRSTPHQQLWFSMSFFLSFFPSSVLTTLQ